MKIYFRLDANDTVGWGHYYRSKVLADLCQKRGLQVEFLLSDDALQEVLPRNEQRVLFVDHYKLGADFEASMKPHFSKLVALDDLRRPHSADLLIDYYSGIADGELRSLNSGDVLSGKAFALIDPKFGNMARLQKRAVQKILIYLGSVGPALIEKVLQALPPGKDITVLSRNFSSNTVRILDFSAAIEEIYPRYDFIIGAAGVAMMERMAAGVPCLNFICVDNQLGMAGQFADDPLHFFSGDLRKMEAEEVAEVIRESISAYEGHKSSDCYCGVDLKGAERIFDKMSQVFKD